MKRKLAWGSWLGTLLALAWVWPAAGFGLSDLPASPASLRDPAGRGVLGIVCDNLAGAPRTGYLTVHSETLAGAQVLSVSITNPDGSLTDLDGAPNAGSLLSNGNAVTVTGDALTYYPPDEFNPDQHPEAPSDLLPAATRTVQLRARLLKNGQTYLLEKEITLARPPVVLIHGINSGPGNWNPFIAALSGIRMPFVALNHFAPRQRYPNGLMRGNGPVEIGGKLLKELIERTLAQVRTGQPITDSHENVGAEVHTFSDYAGMPLAANRVDVVAWSYGGVIARWYLAAKTGVNARLLPKYQAAYRLTIPNDYAYGGDVRKLITLGSMWRGVPLANYVNEARFPPAPGGVNLGSAPVGGILTVRAALDRITDGTTPIPTNVPSLEVMAVESPWLSYLNHGVVGTAVPRPAPKPFRAEVAYAGLAGDDYRFLNGADVYSTLTDAQTPSWFPYLALEARKAPPHGASDGVVPLWSSLLPGLAPDEAIVPTHHGGYLTDPVTQSRTAVLLASNAVPLGHALTARWTDPILASDSLWRWDFVPHLMAPAPQSEVYTQIRGAGRILPAALRECYRTEAVRTTRNQATVTWRTAATSTGRVRVVQSTNGAPLPGEGLDAKPTHSHSVTFTRLQPGATYTYELDYLAGGVPLTGPARFRRAFTTRR